MSVSRGCVTKSGVALLFAACVSCLDWVSLTVSVLVMLESLHQPAFFGILVFTGATHNALIFAPDLQDLFLALNRVA